jgi:hypothetical protein
MSKPFDSPEFKKLQKEWAEKLKQEGFEDIESDKGNLKQWASSVFKSQYSEVLFQAKEDYYRIANQLLHEYVFNSALERKIWMLHAQGMGHINIATQLKAEGEKVYRDLVQRTIARVAKEVMYVARKK